MRYVFQKIGQHFPLVFPDSLLGEANLGTDPNNLYFPAVSTCTCLALLLDDDTLLGAHFDKGLSNFDVYIMLHRMSQLKAARNVTRMVVVGNLTFGENDPTCFMCKPDFRNGHYLTTFAEAFDFNGHVFSHDQGGAANKHYRMQAAGGGNMPIYSANVLSVHGHPVPFNPYQTLWMAQPVT